MTLLICNIGSRDVDWDALPELKPLSQRERGARLLAETQLYAPRIALPLIGKALRHAQRQGEISQVVLIASDQGAEPTDKTALKNWQSDTLYVAQMVAQVITRGDGWAAIPAERITIWLIGQDDGRTDPSDYDLVRAFFERRLPALVVQHPVGPVFLEVTGGTPAMTTGLLIAGSEVFGERAQALYIQERSELPATLNTSRRLAAGPLRAALKTHTVNYAYDAALSLLHQQQATVTERLRPGAGEVLEAVLDYARCRYNFDFPRARRAIEGGVDRAGDGRWRSDLLTLHGAITQPNRTTLLAEVYHGAAARYITAAYADFLTQVVRFQENAFRALCLDRGAKFLDRNNQPLDYGSKVDRAWAQEQCFQLYNNNDATGRVMLQKLASHLAAQRGENIEQTLHALSAFDKLAYLRNELIHGFNGVHKLDLARRFGGEKASESAADTILPHMATCFQQVAGRGPGDSPYARITRMIDDLLREG